MDFYFVGIIVTVCVFVRHLFSFYPSYFDFHSARIIFDVSSGFYLISGGKRVVRNTIFRKALPSVVSGYGKRSINLNKVVATFEKHIF
jgi:hypothetical protein